jgi:hypothetical protein
MTGLRRSQESEPALNDPLHASLDTDSTSILFPFIQNTGCAARTNEKSTKSTSIPTTIPIRDQIVILYQTISDFDLLPPSPRFLRLELGPVSVSSERVRLNRL